ncbi:MAG: GIY-YIG nuclease family protein [Patescibacteria group bacterium]
MIKSGQLKLLPNTPGVYLFKHAREILYIGKATDLRNRVKSYSGKDLHATRGEWLVKMMQEATRVAYRKTDSVLEALILEASLIKKYQPKYNAKEKDDSSFYFVVITKEKYSRVLLVRGKDLVKTEYKNSKIFGPFPHSSEIRTAMKLIRKIFPFRDKCKPNPPAGGGKACFNYQIGLCAGVCNGAISQPDYQKIIKQLKLFFAGKKKSLLKNLQQEMKDLAQTQKFEQAELVKKRLFALQHIQDVALIKSENINLADQNNSQKKFRLEAYDVAHLAGQSAVGVMVVLENGEFNPNQYRKFKLREAKPGDDLAGLREILERRFNHPEWRLPDLLVIDGGKTQLNLAKKVLQENNLQNIKLVSVVKDERHKAREILGDKISAREQEKVIIKINHEAHRFAIAYHRKKRRKALF